MSKGFRIFVLIFSVLIPNIISTLLIRVRPAAPDASRTSGIILSGVLIALFLTCTLMAEQHLLHAGNFSAAAMIPAGIALNILANAMPLILKKPVSIILSYSYQLDMQFYALLLGILAASLAFLIYGSRHS